jgi:hypothetical protein
MGSLEYEHVRWAASAVSFHVCEMGTTNGKSEWPPMYTSGSGHMGMYIQSKRSIGMPASAGFGDADSNQRPDHVVEMSERVEVRCFLAMVGLGTQDGTAFATRCSQRLWPRLLVIERDARIRK